MVTAPILLTIGGVSVPQVMQESMIIKTVLGKTISTMNFTIYDKNCTLSVPKEGIDVIATRSDTGERIFGGLTSIPKGRTEGVSRYWDIQCQSYTVLLDRTLFYYSYPPAFTYTNLASKALVGDRAILAHLFEKACVGSWGQTASASEIVIDTDYVQQGSASLVALNFLYTYAREAVELLSHYVGFNYYVDYYKNLHYYYKETIPATFGLSSVSGETLVDSQGNTLNTVPYNNLGWTRDATRVINNYTIFGSDVISNTQTSFIAGDGSKTTLSIAVNGTAFPIMAPAGQSHISVWVNTGSDVSPSWTAKTVGGTGNNPSSYDCIADYINQSLVFAVAPPNLTYAVKIQYRFLFAGGMPSTDQPSITYYGRTFSNRLTASDANSAATMQVNINHLKEQFSSALETITCKVDDSAFPGGNTNRFKIGQWVPFHNHILGVLKNYQIHSITTRCLGGSILSYELELRNWTLE